MTSMMKVRECHSSNNPLILAVRRDSIKLESLTEEGGDLKAVEFVLPDQVTLEVLAGMHRVYAA